MRRTRMPPSSTARISLASMLLMLVAPSCQEPNPEFDGAAMSSNDTGAPSTSTGVGPSTGVETSSATEVNATTTSEVSTGEPPSTASSGEPPGTSSSEGSSGTTDGCTMCGPDCVDLQTDHDNCGECDNRCHPAQEQCVDAVCVPN